MMKKAILFWSCLLLLAGKMAMAQESSPQSWHHNLFVGVSPKFLPNHSPNLEHFRPEGGYGSTIYVKSKINNTQYSVCYELLSPDQQWGFSTGVQYTQYWKQIGYDALDPDEIHTMTVPDYYLFEIQNDDNQLEYMRIRGIEQHSYYMGIPLEVRRYITFGSLTTFRILFMAETDFDFLVGNMNQVNFINDAMVPFAEQISSNYDNPSPLLASAYLGSGIQFKNHHGFGVNFNWLIHLGDFCGSTGLLKQDSGCGGIKLQFKILIPLK